MAFFKFRKGGGDDSQATQRPTESVEAMRKRARHRLIGAVVLVLIGVIGFPLLFDTQPRPIAVDIPIEIPDRNKVKPLTVPAQPAVVVASQSPAPAAVVQAPPAVTPPAPESAVVAKVETPATSVPVPEAKPQTKPEPKPEAKPPAKPEPKAEAPKPEPKVAESKPAVKTDDGAKARALLEGKPVEAKPADAAAESGRFVVQVGAFADSAVAQETRRKVERAGLKTYTNVAETKDGKRIRVRVGPFATRDEAVRAADKIKGLELPAAILTL